MIEKVEQYFNKNLNAFKNGYGKSVHYGDNERFNIAKEEYNKTPIRLEIIVEYVNEL